MRCGRKWNGIGTCGGKSAELQVTSDALTVNRVTDNEGPTVR